MKVRAGYVNTAHGIELSSEKLHKKIEALEEHGLSMQTEKEHYKISNVFREDLDREDCQWFFEKVLLSKTIDRSR